MNPSGEQYIIEAGGYAAVVTEVGASLRELRYENRHLVAGFDADELRPVYRGAVLAPWPNRIADGAYAFANARHQLPLTEPARSNALHGLVAWCGWQPVEHTSDRVTLGHRLHPRDGYPFRIDLWMSYTVGAEGLDCSLVAENSGDVAAPYGCGSHCYLVAGPGRVDDWTFELNAGTYLEVTPDRMLPVETHPVDATTYDFRAPRVLGDVFVDHAFTNLARDGAGRSAARLLAGDGNGVAITWGSSCPWVQVHTADRPEARLNRSGLAVEPMTCPPDAFNSGTDLVLLPPGRRHEARWVISAICQAPTS